MKTSVWETNIAIYRASVAAERQIADERRSRDERLWEAAKPNIPTWYGGTLRNRRADFRAMVWSLVAGVLGGILCRLILHT